MGLNLNDQMKLAVCVVLSRLPDKEADRDEVIYQALAEIRVNGSEKEEAEVLIRRLVCKSPECYGVQRRKGFWRIVLKFLNQEEAIRAYLQRFPELITDQQRQSIVNYLVDEMKFPFDFVNKGLARFGRRQRAIRTTASSHDFGAW